MREVIHLIELFWIWVRRCDYLYNNRVEDFTFDPLSFPEFIKMRTLCILSINSEMSTQEKRAFLFCMALDSEEEIILDNCKEKATERFLIELISEGVYYPQRDTRWQMAELLQRSIPGRDKYLKILLDDDDPYVRKRANNIKKKVD